MRISVIVTTYNWPRALSMVLGSLVRQTRPPDEIVVADDGSGPETAEAVRDALGGGPVSWRHVRHEDRGARQSRIKNLGVRHASGGYLLFLDHDTVPHPSFVEDHAGMASKGVFLQGKRVFLPEGFTGKLLERGSFEPPGLLMRGLGNRKNALRCPMLGRVIARSRRFQRSLRGCNLSMAREDFMLVDGFDEIFDSVWGREDSDICYRLFHSGLGCRNLWFMAVQYHLHHPVQKSRVMDRRLNEVRGEKRRKALRGFSALSDEGGLMQAGEG